MPYRLVAFLSVALASTLPGIAQGVDARRADAPYVFVGTVVETDGPAGVASRSSALVRVDQVVFQRGTFENQAGRHVRVLGVPSSVKANGRYEFYVEPVTFGETITATSIDVADVASAAGRTIQSSDARRAYLQREIQGRLATATVIVVGAVVRVSPLAEAPSPESEHLPELRLARVKVDRVLQGGRAAEVEFVFSASRDVQWYRAPKFSVGDRGVFLLKPAPGGELERLTVGRQRLTLLDPLDFRTPDELPLVEAALKEPRR